MVQDNPLRYRRVARRASLAAASAFVALLSLSAVPSAAAFSVEVLDGTVLDAWATAGTPSTSFEFVYRFQLEHSRSLDLVVVPDRANPVYLNGTAGSHGWWTEVVAVEEGDDPVVATTDGSGPVSLGYLSDDGPVELRLRVHAPAEALAAAGGHVALYRLQESSRWHLFGEDDPEGQDLQATVNLVPAAQPDSMGEAGQPVPPPEWNVPQVALVAGSAIMALGLIAIFGGGRK